jgi:hypothetical protein
MCLETWQKEMSIGDRCNCFLGPSNSCKIRNNIFASGLFTCSSQFLKKHSLPSEFYKINCDELKEPEDLCWTGSTVGAHQKILGDLGKKSSMSYLYATKNGNWIETCQWQRKGGVV